MRIVHVAPYGPQRAGIYEAARDMVRADALQGHSVAFVDVGAQPVDKAERETPQVGAIDDRGGWQLLTEPPSVLNTADVIVMHTGCPNEWVVGLQAPFVWIVHGTPSACFHSEMRGPHKSYSVTGTAASWPRSRAMVHFWPEFKPFWDIVMPQGKQVIFTYPPIDTGRFNPDGAAYDIPRFQRGRYNGLIADSWREDCDPWEMLHGALEASRRIPGLTWHLYASPQPDGALDPLFSAMRSIGALGGVLGRIGAMETVYRGFDFVISARRSISRVIAEALCCGTPVIAARKCSAANSWADPDDPDDVASAVQAMVYRLENDRDALRAETNRLAERFDLASYGRAMTRLYESILN